MKTRYDVFSMTDVRGNISHHAIRYTDLKEAFILAKRWAKQKPIQTVGITKTDWNDEGIITEKSCWVNADGTYEYI